ncbi:MAG: CPBP family intramembrane metalloprotease [Kiritimatiellae bacterium]|nr:CPBP family intramembrane metalloprotease [Kiritimatiellia bacterium]
MSGQCDSGKAARVVLGIFGYLALALAAGALVAPHVFNLLMWLGRQGARFETLRNIEFEEVSSRCVLIAILLGLIPALRMGGLDHIGKLGLGRDPHWLRRLAGGWLLGTGSMSLLVLGGVVCGAYRLADGLGADVLGRVLMYVGAALVVGFLEEPIFRGALFGLLRRGFGLLAAAMLASLLFAIVHFAAPDPPVGVVHGRWYSGLYLLGYMFSAVDVRWGFGFMFLTLFAIGMILCLLYEHRGTLYYVIGLHAGWVWIMRLASDLFARDPARWTILFGPSTTVPKSLAAVLLSLAFLLGAAFVVRSGRARGFARDGQKGWGAE